MISIVTNWIFNQLTTTSCFDNIFEHIVANMFEMHFFFITCWNKKNESSFFKISQNSIHWVGPIIYNFKSIVIKFFFWIKLNLLLGAFIIDIPQHEHETIMFNFIMFWSKMIFFEMWNNERWVYMLNILTWYSSVCFFCKYLKMGAKCANC